MANIDTLISPLKMEVATAPRPTMIRMIISAARDFCERTTVMREEITVASVIGQGDYTPVPADTDMCVHHYDAAVYGEGYKLEPASRVKLEMNDSDWRNRDAQPNWFLMNGATLNGSPTVKVVPMPIVAGDDMVFVAITKPKNGVEDLPAFLIDQYWDALFAGTLARLYRMGAHDWANPEMSNFYQMEYERFVGEAYTRADQSHTRKKTTVGYGGI